MYIYIYIYICVCMCVCVYVCVWVCVCVYMCLCVIIKTIIVQNSTSKNAIHVSFSYVLPSHNRSSMYCFP